MDREDVRVRERGDCLGFALEARQRVRIPREQVGQQLDRHVAIEPRVARAIDLAHASRAEGGLDDIRADASAGAQWHGGQTTRNERASEILGGERQGGRSLPPEVAVGRAQLRFRQLRLPASAGSCGV